MATSTFVSILILIAIGDLIVYFLSDFRGEECIKKDER